LYQQIDINYWAQHLNIQRHESDPRNSQALKDPTIGVGFGKGA
jgi:hypothetical protein